MDKARIIRFLDSLEERGIMTADQQAVVLRTENEDVVAGSNLSTCTNRSAESCTGNDNYNAKCTNIGKVACAGSTNNVCENTLIDSIVTNLQIDSCKKDNKPGGKG